MKLSGYGAYFRSEGFQGRRPEPPPGLAHAGSRRQAKPAGTQAPLSAAVSSSGTTEVTAPQAESAPLSSSPLSPLPSPASPSHLPGATAEGEYLFNSSMSEKPLSPAILLPWQELIDEAIPPTDPAISTPVPAEAAAASGQTISGPAAPLTLELFLLRPEEFLNRLGAEATSISSQTADHSQYSISLGEGAAINVFHEGDGAAGGTSFSLAPDSQLDISSHFVNNATSTVTIGEGAEVNYYYHYDGASFRDVLQVDDGSRLELDSHYVDNSRSLLEIGAGAKVDFHYWISDFSHEELVVGQGETARVSSHFVDNSRWSLVIGAGETVRLDFGVDAGWPALRLNQGSEWFQTGFQGMNRQEAGSGMAADGTGPLRSGGKEEKVLGHELSVARWAAQQPLRSGMGNREGGNLWTPKAGRTSDFLKLQGLADILSGKPPRLAEVLNRYLDQNGQGERAKGGWHFRVKHEQRQVTTKA